MLVQALREFMLPDGRIVRVGEVLDLPEAIAADFLRSGILRERTEWNKPAERKDLPDELPRPDPILQPPGTVLAYEDRDNFVRNLVTVAEYSGEGTAAAYTTGRGGVPSPPSRSARDAAPLIPLDEIKIHLRVELDFTYEDAYITGLEAAARTHTENYLRLALDATTFTSNMRQAMLFLIAHFYRHRESVADASLVELPMAYVALLHPERDFTGMY